MRARRDLGHDAAEEAMRVLLRRDAGREDAPVAVEKRDGGLVAGRLEGEDDRPPGVPFPSSREEPCERRRVRRLGDAALRDDRVDEGGGRHVEGGIERRDAVGREGHGAAARERQRDDFRVRRAPRSESTRRPASRGRPSSSAPRRRTGRRARGTRARVRTSRPCSRRRRSRRCGRRRRRPPARGRARSGMRPRRPGGASRRARPRLSSHAVRRAPCRNGRVSSARIASGPSAASARTTPSAVPIPAVASAPALQCVRTVGAPATPGPAALTATSRRGGRSRGRRGDPPRRCGAPPPREGGPVAGTRPRSGRDDGAHPADRPARGSRRSVAPRRASRRRASSATSRSSGHASGHPARLGAEAVRRGDADQRGAAHRKAANGLGRLGGALAVEEHLLVREAALVEEPQPPGRVRVRR